MPNATLRADARTLPEETQDRLNRFSELEESLRDAVVWASLLDSVVDEIDRFSSMSKRESDVVIGQLNRVTEALKQAVDEMDTIYHQRTEEEAAR
jgi:hypothetical protein